MKPVLLFVALAFLDLATTFVAFSQGSGEANPIMAWVLRTGGPYVFILVKIVSILPLSIYMLGLEKRWWLYLLSIPSAGICVWNIVMILRRIVK